MADLLLRDAKTTLQPQYEWGSSETHHDSITLEDSFSSHTQRDTGHANQERISKAGGRPDQTFTVAMLATRFVENVKSALLLPAIANLAKSRFGVESHQTTSIFGTLGKFKHGAVSKREVIATISEALGCHDDLKRDLMNVFHHRESRWGVDDFDLPLLPIEPSTPQCLQPVHEPRMRIPSLFTPWDVNISHLIMPTPVVKSDFDRQPSFEQLNSHGVSATEAEHAPWNTSNRAIFSGSATSDHLGEPATDQLTLPGIGHKTHTPTYSNYNHHTETATLYLEERDDSQRLRYEQPWGRLDCDNTWESEAFAQLGQHEDFLVSDQQCSPSVVYGDTRPESSHLHRRSESVTAISPQHSPTALLEELREGLTMSNGLYRVPISEPTIDMPPPPKKRNHKSLVLEDQAEECGVFASAKHESDVKEIQPTHTYSSKRSRDASSSRKQSQGGGAYVHGLCGKSFTERSKVKKHHWGNKNDNLNTTTGCWHRNERPNVSWDDHPSCKSAPRPAPRNSRRARSANEDPKATVVPEMVPNYRNVVPGFFTLQDLPRTVTEVVDPTPTPSSFVQDGPMYNRAMQQSYLLYNSYGFPRRTLPSSSPFESLLTVVNAAAKIEEPTPRGRNDSVVICDLDAQAIAAERTGQYTPTWAFNPGFQEDDYHNRHYLPASTDNGFTMGSPSPAQDMPGHMVFPQSGSIDYATSDVSPTFSTPVYADQHAFVKTNEGEAAGQGFGLHPLRD